LAGWTPAFAGVTPQETFYESIKLEPLKESGLIFPGMKLKWFGRKNGKDFQSKQKAVG